MTIDPRESQVVVAIAREMAAFAWAITRTVTIAT